MSVRPILLQKDGAIFGTPGAYRTSPPPIAGPYAGSELLEDVTYYTVNTSGEAELVTVKAYPFYVNSASGGLDTSGDGTIENPWRSVNYALSQLQSILTCLNSTSCCTYLVLRVKGTVDYMVQYNGGSTFNGYNRFIIEPWNLDNIEISLNNQNYFIYEIYGTVFKNIILSSENETYPSPFIGACKYCIFNNISINTTSTATSIYGYITGFNASSYSVFYQCPVNISVTGEGGSVAGFYGCDNSIFYESNASISGENKAIYAGMRLYGFLVNTNSAFNECNGNIYTLGGADVAGCGFKFNTNSTYLNCSGNSLNLTDCDI